jgi:hypothetical protein
VKVAVFGGCVTRDVFVEDEGASFRLHRYFARSSLASAMCPVPFPTIDTTRVPSNFQREMVEQDLRGDFAAWLAEDDFELLVIDSVPERNALFVDSRDALATRTTEMLTANPDVSPYRIVWPHTEEFFGLWEAAWTSLVETLDRIGARERIRVNRVRWATEFDAPGASFSEYHNPLRIERSNTFLERAYARMERDLPPEQFYRFADDELLAATEHKWGIAPFHYTPAYYRRLTEHLRADAERHRQAGLRPVPGISRVGRWWRPSPVAGRRG